MDILIARELQYAFAKLAGNAPPDSELSLYNEEQCAALLNHLIEEAVEARQLLPARKTYNANREQVLTDPIILSQFLAELADVQILLYGVLAWAQISDPIWQKALQDKLVVVQERIVNA